MTEQCVNQQEDARKCNRGAAKHEERDYHSDVENAEERHRYERTISEPLHAVDPEQQELSGRRKPALVRSKTFDHSLLTQVQPESDSKIERKKSHYSQKDILYQGRMFVSDHWICFHSKVFGKDTKIAIPVISVTHIKKTKTAILVPNALVIATANDREKSPCSSPIPSSLESSFRSQRSPLSPRFPLVEFSVPPFVDVLKHTDSAAPPEHPDHQQKVKNQLQNQQSSENKQHEAHHGGSELAIDSRPLKPVSFNTVLFVYLFLNDFLQGSDGNAELFSELLTINLMKLEKAILLPHPDILRTTSHDPQTLCDAMETGHEEPEAPDEGRKHGR
ncbi:GRAM domain-containing protein 2B, partial [Nibea albiflora]